MELSLPDDVRAALSDAGLSDDEVLLKDGEELREAIGDRMTYKLIAALNGQGLTIARWPGHRGSLPQADLIPRNLRILEMRLVDRKTFPQIARDVGLASPSRASEILRQRFGIGGKRRQPLMLRVPEADVPVLRAAVLQRLQEVTEDLLEAITIRGDVDAALDAWDEVRYLYRDVQRGKELYVGGGRGTIVAQALRDHSAVEHRDTCRRLLEAMPS